MDNLTHGLLGLAVAALRRPGGAAATDRAVVWAALLAAELPDLDIFLGGGDPLASFKYHRGLTHAFALAPVVAGVATILARLLIRGSRLGPVYLYSLLSVLVAHILADLWTGWGTMALLPFSPVRLGLDWVSILDPIITLPLLAAAIAGWRRPGLRRRAMVGALAFALVYVGLRGGLHTALGRAVAAQYPRAARVQVWPSFNPLGPWNYAVAFGDTYAAGTVHLWQPVQERRRLPAPAAEEPAVAALLSTPALQPLFSFTAFPVITPAADPGGGSRLAVRDLKYSYFTYMVTLDHRGALVRVDPP